MYMRLPWIVGQSGLFITIGIVLIAHTISVTTGLSVSSIATDKKVKAGGTYYIISRSLGLPIGGTLGIALFFGLSLSVSLYLIGFSESFLGFMDIPITKDTIRLTGSLALLTVATLTFISTSLAIKTQYFIMTAIFLSLLTILFGNTDFKPVTPLLNPIENSAPLIVLFAIFFPAVTGFEAGVSMSGDLENPKKSIPVGTISAIVLGLLVYIGLSFFFAYNVDSEQLVNNPNILLDMSLFPPLLVAGIWGATISSAIGSILGAPRILQATSSDRITPKIFAKGFGPTNEPRNALILTFVIAEAGILIGELNLIARIVSMFFITTYGFLNLSSTIEKLTSTDFRPSFKIPVWISIVGAILSFYLMLELDFVALIGATIIMGGIFVYLKNKELTLESGDTWEGVWSSLLRAGLNKLNATVKQQRNWRPNIILFSGGESARPHLLQFGRWLVKKRGILSNFNLIENKDSSHLIKKNQDDPKDKKEEFEGIFARQMEVKNIYDGMETITKVYGFAGIEPNSVMFGWARDTKDKAAFNKLLRTYQKLDYNIFMLDYNKENGFGKNKTIDLWWRGSGNNATLALTLIKFLQMEDDWSDAVARIFIITDDTAIHNRVFRNMSLILDDQRIAATFKVINNSIDNKPFSEIIQIESKDTDLVILGMPTIEKDDDIIEKTDTIIRPLKTVLLIHASSFFNPLYIGVESKTDSGEKMEEIISEKITSEIDLPQNELLANESSKIFEILENAFLTLQNQYLTKIVNRNKSNLEKYYTLIVKSLTEFESTVDLEAKQKGIKIASRVISNYLFNSRTIIEDFKNNSVPEQSELLLLGIESFKAQINALLEGLPEELTYIIEKDIQNKESKTTKFLMKAGIIKNEIKIKVKLKHLVQFSTIHLESELLFPLLSGFTVSHYQLVSRWQKLNNSVADSYLKLESLVEKEEIDLAVLNNEKIRIEDKYNILVEEYLLTNKKLVDQLKIGLKNFFEQFSHDIQNPKVNRLVRKNKKGVKKLQANVLNIIKIPDNFERNERLISNFFIQDLLIKGFVNRMEKILERNIQDLSIFVDSNYLTPLQDIIGLHQSLYKDKSKQIAFKQKSDSPLNENEIIENLMKDFESAISALPENIEIMTEESFQNLENIQFEDVNAVEINLKRYLNFIVETEIIEPIQNKLHELSNQLEKDQDITGDIIRFTNYNLIQNIDEESQNRKSFTSVLKQSIERLEKETENLVKIKNLLFDEYRKYFNVTIEKLNPYLINRSAGDFKHSVRAKESKEIVSGAKDYYKKSLDFLKNTLVRLIYKQSEGVLLAKKFGEQSKSYQTETGKILNVVNQLIPEPEVLNALPFYYKQLFLGKHFRSKEFLIPRKNEINKASEVIENYKNGFKGGMLILGEPYSGKSTLSATIANKFFDGKKIFQINPPESGSISLEEFEKQLRITFNQTVDTEAIFNSMANGTVLILHDLELWWERSQQGFTVINKIVELIEKYSDRCFFIINSTSQAFHFINLLQSIENIFIGAIHCQPFDAEDIQDAILIRHKSSGFKFELEKQDEDEISNLRLANLFNTYFDISRGNIGLAILNWIANIQKVKQSRIVIVKPEDVKDYFLNNLNTDWFLFLQQFVLHKQLNLIRISRILGIEENKASQSVDYLKRSGLIVEFKPSTFHINPYLHNLISKKLVEMELL